MNMALSMTAEQIVDLLTQKQILIDEKNGELSLSYPKGALTAELISLIRDNKPQLLEFLSTQVLAEPSTDAQTITPVPRTEQGIYPVSFAQRRFWFLDKMAGGSTENNMPFALLVSGDFNPEVAQQAIRRIMARHESLRTTMVEHDGEVMQCIHQQADFTLTQVDLRSLSIEAQAIEAQRLLLADNNKVFDLSADYPLRASYLRQSDKAGKPCGILMFNMHHIASDGWSIGLLINEFVAFYQACLDSALDSLEPDNAEFGGLAPLSLQYVDYACWQRQWLNDERLSKQLSWWQQQLSDAPVVHSLGLDYPRPAVKSYQGAVVEDTLSQSLSEQLQQLALAQDVTLFMLLHSAIAIVLSRHSGSDDIVIGTPVANRTQTQLEPLIGCFINTLVLRTTVGQTCFGDYLAQVKQVNLAAQAHQDIPFEYLVEHCNVTRTTEHTPLFQIMFTINTNEAGDLTMPGVEFSAVSAGAPVAKFDLEINAQFTAEGISIAWVYDTALFTEARVSQYQAHLHSLLHSLAVQANQLHDLPLAQLTMLSREETNDLLKRFNGPESAPQFDFSPEQSSATTLARQPLIHQLFEQQAKLTPQAIALQFGTEQLSYQTLNHKSNQLAHHLRTLHLRTLHLQVKDIGSQEHPEILVGLCIERSVDMVVALLAIMKGGAAYLPMDPSYPKDRLTAMIDDSGLHCVVTQSHLHELFNHAADLQLVSVDDNSIQQTLQTYPQDDLSHSLTQQALAYVIYTSGSTGQPKGVMIEHGAMVNFLYGMKQKLAESLSAEAKWLALTTIAFDIAGLELLGPLSFGAQVVLASKDDAINPARLAQLLQSQQINVMQATPSSWQMLVSDGWQGKSDLLVLSGGEPLPQALAQTLANNNRQLINCYGPTEATVWSMANTVDVKADATEQTALAEPLANYQHYVLDKNLVPVPVGAIGGLYIGGASLARGYLNQPELTAERFIDWRFKADPTSADAANTTRLYQTGDLVRVLPQGGLQFIGRDDEQVKIRGFRIELDEISHHLLKLEPVVACVVRAVNDQQGHPILVVYVEIISESDMTNSQLNDYLTAQLRAALPHYMVPSSFIKIANWPLTPNGKVNKKALPEPQMALNHGDNMSDYVAPISATEQQMTEIWAQLLGVAADKISVKDNFFALGGHSLLAVKLVAKIRSEFNQELAVSEVFSLADIRALAAALDKRAGAGADNNTPVRPMITAQSRTSEQMPVSFAQQRMWLIDKMAGSSVQYNMPVALQVSGAFDLAAAQTAIGQIIERHESLRTVFAEQEGTVVQVIKPSVDFVLPQQDLTELNVAEQQQKVRQLVKADSQKSFDLSADLMIRASYLKLNPQAEAGNGILLFNMHHIASDGWSMNILINEFVALYSACLPSQSASANQQLAPLTLQYADYAQWQNQWLSGGVLQAQQDYWQQQLADIPAVHGLTLDFARPEIKSYQGQLVKGQLSAGVSESLKQLARAQDATVFMVLHAALALVLSRHSDGNEMVIGTPVANRMQSELEPLIGCFVNTLVLKTSSYSGQSFNDYLADVREVNLSAQNNQDIPFEHLVELCKVPRSTSYTPLFQIMLTLNISEEEALLSVPGVQFTPLEPDDMVAKFDLDITIQLSAEGIELYWVYDQALFSKARIETFNRHLETLLCSVAQNPDISLAALSMLSSNEYDYLVHQLNDAQMTMPAISSELLIHQLFEQQVLLVPDKPAVATKDGAAMSYQQLNEASNRLAHYLREQGVGAETLVGLCVGRTANMLIGMLGILKAGGAYVPLDPDYPLARLQYILQDTGLKHLLTESEPAQALDLPQAVQVSRIDALADFATYSAQNPLTLSEQHSSNLAYVIYTSGSTGKPKGVLIEHRQLLTRMQAFIQIVPLTSSDIVPSIASFAFDISLLELVYPLTCGAQIRLISQPDIVDLTQLKAQLADCTFVHMVPSLARAWLEALKSDQAGTGAANSNNSSINSSKNKLRYFATGGDKVPRSLLLELDETLSQTTILQFYGPTEATLFSVCNQHISVDNTTLGRPIDGASLYILKEDNSLAPMGVVGELHIGGAGLARGYLNRPELSGEKFIASPFNSCPASTESRLYKTGDLARYTDDGQLVFVGRSDSQIKIRGFRIEPGEIENCLNQVDDVEEVIVLPDVSENSGGDITGLTAYVKGAKKYPWLAGLTSLKNSLDIKFWPSVGEYPVYDDLIYQGLSQDQYRNDVYLKAYRQHVKDKVVMDIGAGASAIQSLLCVEAGARKVYAVEISEQAANKARAKIKKLGLEDKITVFNGDAAQLNFAEILPEKIDVCTQEVVESIAGAEGIAAIMNGIADNLLANTSHKPLMLPTKAYTMMAAVTLPDHLKHKMALTGKAREYVEKVFAATGKTFDLRMGVTNFPQSHLLSTAGVFEALDFNQRCLIDYSHQQQIEVMKDGVADGLLLWLKLDFSHPVDNEIASDNELDTINGKTSWYPIFVPAFYPNFSLKKGDKLDITCAAKISEDGVHPDYQLEGTIVRGTEQIHSFVYQLPYIGEEINYQFDSSTGQSQSTSDNLFYQQLFSGHYPDSELNESANIVSRLQRIAAEQLPQYMQPSKFVLVEEWPLTPTGKIDSKALMASARNAGQSEYVAPETETQQQLVDIWAQVLAVNSESISIHANFFDIGGHSLLVTNLIHLINSQFSVDLTIREAFSNQVLSECAELIDSMRETHAADVDEAQLAVDEMSDEEVQAMLLALEE